MANKLHAMVEWLEKGRRDVIPIGMLSKSERSVGSVVQINKNPAKVIATGGMYYYK